MKGLLHRLAARAAGTALVVRSDARLPYGADGLAWGDAPENPVARAPEDVGSVAAPARVPAQSSRSNVEVFEQNAQVGAVLLQPATLCPVVPDASPLSREAPPLHRADASTPAMEPVAAPEAPAGGRIDAPPQPMLPPAAKRREPAAISPEPPPRGARLSAEPLADESPHSLHPSLRGAASTAYPAPLLPAAPHLADGATGEPAAHLSAPERPQMAWPLATSASAADEATEVHIHIGRIDVTAVHEAPKVRVKPRAKSPALSLDAYLAARSRP